MSVVDRVETHQRGEKADVGLRDRIAHQVSAIGQTLLQPIHRSPQPVVGRVVRLLRPRETAAVHAVVDLGENARHHRFHLVGHILRPQIRGALAVELLPLRREIAGDLVEVVRHHRAVALVDHRRHRDAARVVGLAREVRVLQPLDAQHRIDAAGVEIERPRPRIMHRAGQAHRDDVLQAQQPAHDDRPVRPWARLRGDEAVTVRLDRVAVFPVDRDARGDVPHVAVEVFALVHVDARRVVRIRGLVVVLGGVLLGRFSAVTFVGLGVFVVCPGCAHGPTIFDMSTMGKGRSLVAGPGDPAVMADWSSGTGPGRLRWRSSGHLFSPTRHFHPFRPVSGVDRPKRLRPRPENPRSRKMVVSRFGRCAGF